MTQRPGEAAPREAGPLGPLRPLHHLAVAVAGRRRLVIRLGAALAVVVLIVAWARFASRVRALRDLRASSATWGFPSRLYSADLALEPGADLSPAYLARQLEARGYQRVAAPPRIGGFTPGPGRVEIGLRGAAASTGGAFPGGPERVRVLFQGSRIRTVERLGGLADSPAPDSARSPRLEPVLFSVALDSSRVRATWVPLGRVPRVVQQAVIASEDRRFRRHFGLDLRSNARALVTNVRAGGARQGGSTLTQQLARTLFLGRERTLARKLVEAVLAAGLELALSKDDILEMYLNAIYWGQDGSESVVGIAEAARHYFGVPVDSLGLGQAALLAGIIPAPNTLSPLRNPRLGRRARSRVLRDLVEVGVVDSAAARAAAEAPLGVRHALPPAEGFPSFVGLVREELSRRLGAHATERRGMVVITTLDPAWQRDAESLLAAGLSDLDAARGGEPLEGAFVAMNARSGEIRAVVGGRAAATGTFNRASQARRQPGSAIKPVVYAAALDAGRGPPRFSPASTVPDERREFPTPEGPWSPRNDDGDYHPEVTLAKALAKSLNVATANLVAAIGPSEVARYAQRFGLGRPKAVASIGLGTNEVSVLDLTAAYAAFANGGLRPAPTTLRHAVDARGRDLTPRVSAPSRAIAPETAALMTGLLEDVVIFGVAYPLRKFYGFARPVAGKTGTTNEFRDAWFVGFTPQVVAGIWVGYDLPRSLQAPAAETALPVWGRIVSRLLEGLPAREFGSDRTLELAWIDPFTGGRARSGCPRPMRVPFLPGTAPRKICGRDHAADWERIRAEALADSLAALQAAGSDSSRGSRDSSALQAH